MNSIENLRKQAKQIVRWHRDRVWTVAEVIRATLPRFAKLSDREILDAEFKLVDAQELVARRAGFDGWQALLNGQPQRSPEPVDAAAPSAERASLVVARPFVFVREIEAACRYYCDVLGFEEVFRYGEPPFYAEIERDGVQLCVRCTDAPILDAELAEREELWTISIEVSDLKALYLELQAAGAEFNQPLQRQPYGVRELKIVDPDGNRLLFFDKPRAHGTASAD
jgi:uncharacterized glyoxalase superfamily protein PhnB